ncbi:hypothetical protein IS481_15665 [Caldimonas thermodepolymerans]|jgi:hypothetical protein|uniref:Uncharacterized protein n=1 Tax=Caldimonas thermodepolymerans TaxID=215580 RepID=A0A2S5T6G3_9BURK|nr:DUF6776 family protein [Caldimonas thermodepolymerans]PPE70478.1 hypothetical protein C1702_07395 [Caldimonas thermodepolymerans]QPC31145.1 hypothetical protein IS481_15665 [Caldimonas thermodepolymerans]RDH96602.1 hypothetical protein DES46_11062 [Caldimonas thermodepolymerans]TCP04799.1 hypothetical protein EV676_11086 [Caldimonas thermodepolymerans]UZG43875.1 hypothetical protein ONZ46_16055 [Caldimonas thermodepolymerans]
MRWKLLKRRLSVSAPRMIVRSYLPWPLRWAVVALALGFSAALALWAFEFGKTLSGLQRGSGNAEEVQRLRAELAELREQRDKAQSIANTAESLMRAERVAQERLAEQVRALEAENLALKEELGFFERLLPATGQQPLAVRALHAEVTEPGQLRFQILVMQNGRTLPEFQGRYELTLSGTLDGRSWTQTMPEGPQPLQVKQYRRVEGVIDFPEQAVVKQVQVRVTDTGGALKAQQSLKL